MPRGLRSPGPIEEFQVQAPAFLAEDLKGSFETDLPLRQGA